MAFETRWYHYEQDSSLIASGSEYVGFDRGDTEDIKLEKKIESRKRLIQDILTEIERLLTDNENDEARLADLRRPRSEPLNINNWQQQILYQQPIASNTYWVTTDWAYATSGDTSNGTF